MKTSNEKWQGNSKFKSNAGASRDGKPFEKKDVKSILKGSRGTARYSSQDSRSSNESPYKEVDNSKRENYRSFENKRSYNSTESYNKPYSDKPWEKNSQNGEYKPVFRPKRSVEGESRPSGNYGNRRPYGNPSGSQQRPYNKFNDKPYGRFQQQDGDRPERLTLRKKGEEGQTPYSSERRFDPSKRTQRPWRPNDNYDPNAKYSKKKQLEFRKSTVDMTTPVRLNKYLANAGICSRREADEYIQAGVITVNGEVITEMGTKILPTDKVMFHEQMVRSERKVYILLNKPKDCVTTAEDTHDRMTVLDLVKNACSERIYPVGRLDRNTTGVLLLTNDGDLASKLTHPKYDKKKIYHATLDRELETADFETILAGVALEDTTIAADALDFVMDDDRRQIGIEIHSGQNRVVRRIFEKLGYKVIRLDRVYFAGLTKKNLKRGKYRFLNDREINMLKMGAHE